MDDSGGSGGGSGGGGGGSSGLRDLAPDLRVPPTATRDAAAFEVDRAPSHGSSEYGDGGGSGGGADSRGIGAGESLKRGGAVDEDRRRSWAGGGSGIMSGFGSGGQLPPLRRSVGGEAVGEGGRGMDGRVDVLGLGGVGVSDLLRGEAAGGRRGVGGGGRGGGGGGEEGYGDGPMYERDLDDAVALLEQGGFPMEGEEAVAWRSDSFSSSPGGAGGSSSGVDGGGTGGDGEGISRDDMLKRRRSSVEPIAAGGDEHDSGRRGGGEGGGTGGAGGGGGGGGGTNASRSGDRSTGVPDAGAWGDVRGQRHLGGYGDGRELGGGNPAEPGKRMGHGALEGAESGVDVDVGGRSGVGGGGGIDGGGGGGGGGGGRRPARRKHSFAFSETSAGSGGAGGARGGARDAVHGEAGFEGRGGAGAGGGV